jgi:hypothetical protein
MLLACFDRRKKRLRVDYGAVAGSEGVSIGAGLDQQRIAEGSARSLD